MSAVRIKPGVLCLLGALALLELAASAALAETRAPAPAVPRYIGLTRDVAMESINSSRRIKGSKVTGRKTVLTLEECRGLALQRNLSLEQVAMEAGAKQAIADSYRAQQFPRLISSGELSSRNHFYFSFSDVLGRDAGAVGAPGGTGVDQFARSRDLGTWRYSLESRWSPTDAALAYFLMRNTKNERLKDKLLRIRIGQKLMGVVEAGFYRLLSLNQVLPRIQELVRKREDLAAQSSTLYRERLTLVEDLHRVNLKLTQARGLASAMETEAELQREYLASAMRLGPDTLSPTGFSLSGQVQRPRVLEDFAQLEQRAVEHRPEAYQAGLDHLSASNDLKRTRVKDLPKLTGFGRYTKDIDRHLFNNDYVEYGTYMYFDVVDWAANRQERKAAKIKMARTRSEIESVALGIATQVREAALRYKAAIVEEATTAKLLDSAKRLRDTVKQRVEVGAQTELAVIEADGDLLHEEISHLRAVGEASARGAELESAIGANFSEPLPTE